MISLEDVLTHKQIRDEVLLFLYNDIHSDSHRLYEYEISNYIGYSSGFVRGAIVYLSGQKFVNHREDDSVIITYEGMKYIEEELVLKDDMKIVKK